MIRSPIYSAARHSIVVLLAHHHPASPGEAAGWRGKGALMKAQEAPGGLIATMPALAAGNSEAQVGL
jgi:hypothetical protein